MGQDRKRFSTTGILQVFDYRPTLATLFCFKLCQDEARITAFKRTSREVTCSGVIMPILFCFVLFFFFLGGGKVALLQNMFSTKTVKSSTL